MADEDITVLPAEQGPALRQRASARLLDKLHQYLLKLQPEVLPKSSSGAVVRCALNQWEALTRFLEDGELEIVCTVGLMRRRRRQTQSVHVSRHAVLRRLESVADIR